MEGVSLADLYKFDEIYWVPQDKSEAQLAESPAVEIVADTIAEVKPKVSTPWVVVGQIAEAELSRLKLIFFSSFSIRTHRLVCVYSIGGRTKSF